MSSATWSFDGPSDRGRVRSFLDLVRFEHSVFALPFAYVAALSAMDAANGHVHWIQLLLVTIAMVGARTFAMAVNRIVDRHIDARNPRTRNRELVTGVVSLRTAWVGAVVSLAILFLAAYGLNTLCLVLSPVAAIVLAGYPYAKRFTWAPHAVLALAQTVAPIGAWLAVTGQWSWRAVVLGVAVGLWIGGFDIIYACQDVEVDRAIGVRSLPARFGAPVALRVSSAVHVVTFAAFVWYGVLVDYGGWWYVGLALAAVAFAYEHAIVAPDDLSRVNRAFFTANGFVGVALFAFTLVDLVTRGLHA